VARKPRGGRSLDPVIFDRRLRRALVPLLAAAVLVPVQAAAFAPDQEARNYQKIGERHQHETGSPEYQAMLRTRGLEEEAELAVIRATDPERSPDNLCANHMDGCAGDVRYYSWEQDGHGLRRPVLYTAASGATISGHVWATKAGPARRPGIVITTGSVQAPEELYAFAAATLAKRGYVVLTYDVQAQGRSDRAGAPPDENENSQPQDPNSFLDGSRDALDFFLSSPQRPYVPRPSRTSATVHSNKQERRVKAGLNAGFNPFWDLVDPHRIGVAGHSLGAFAVSQFGSRDERVDAIVAWDNLSIGQTAAPIKPRVPALGMSNDYGLTPTPFTGDPDPQGKSAASNGWSKAGVDTGQINIRGGTHYEYSYIPNPAFGATLRGMDMAAWYTAAWFDKYVKGDPAADRRLLTTRWRDDEQGRAVDSSAPADGNLLSFYLRSRLDIGLARGGRFKCEDMRAGCAGQAADDGESKPYSYLAESTTKDAATPGGGGGSGGGTTTIDEVACVRSIAIPKRLSLAGSKRRLRIELALNERVRTEAGLRVATRPRRLRARTRARLAAGRRVIVLRISKSARPGRHRVTVRIGCAREKVARAASITLRR
jgi:dienelactone hydrolase